MVKSAYSAGKPALGVGPGNVPCYINKNVDLARACTDLIISKTFDNGIAEALARVLPLSVLQGELDRVPKVGVTTVSQAD